KILIDKILRGKVKLALRNDIIAKHFKISEIRNFHRNCTATTATQGAHSRLEINFSIWRKIHVHIHGQTVEKISFSAILIFGRVCTDEINKIIIRNRHSGIEWQSDISTALRSCVYININGRSEPFESKYPSGKGSSIVLVLILVTRAKNHNFLTTDIHIDIWIVQFLEFDHAISHSRVSSAVTQSRI